MVETKRLILREFTPEDARDLQEILGDRETMRHCEPPYTLEKTRTFLKDFCVDRRAALAAALKEGEKVIGYLLCKTLGEEPREDVYEIGWIFNRGYWRQGYAYEASAALVEYLFTQKNAHKLMAEAIDPVKSVGLMEKLGMVREGVQRSHTGDNLGGWADLYLYGMLREDWLRQRKKQTAKGKDFDYAREETEI